PLLSSYVSFFFTQPALTEIFTLSLHDALPICAVDLAFRSAPQNNDGQTPQAVRTGRSRKNIGFQLVFQRGFRFVTFFLQGVFNRDRKSTRLNSSHRTISYAVFCLKKKK